MQRTLFKGIALLTAVITFGLAGCATGVTNTVAVGFVHTNAEGIPGDALGTGEAFGYSVGGSVALSFQGRGISTLEICGAGGIAFGESDLRDTPTNTATNTIPFSLCSEIDMTLGD